jgi:hypothetical protein
MHESREAMGHALDRRPMFVDHELRLSGELFKQLVAIMAAFGT